MCIQQKIHLSLSLTIAGRAPVQPGLRTPVDRRKPRSFVDIFNPVTLFSSVAPVEAGQKPGSVPVNPDGLRFTPVKPRQSPGCRL
ncbi:hypothetical protein DPMN_100529 [Dreissena polymorpha]|uniref:Uncharacterized protein n=1 Tax=Dreissena polymorpha TaxID=45954 RepID=A0A9D4R7H6_DREPO|nr:hypothetical protein DPMN_100529 [Dreissena polymorpha]